QLRGRTLAKLRRMPDLLRFPDGFLFGASISAYQTEGNNTNTDWWWWEHMESTPCREPSGDACDFYHRYSEDVAMLAAAGLNCFRFGIEWARIEPAEGEFSMSELVHYRRVLDACHEHGVAPIVTFHHFTVPLWLHEQGGIASERFPALFERYCGRAAEALGYGPDGPRSPGHDWSDTTRELEETDVTTLMGYEYYPQALGGAIRRAHSSCPGVPVLVTESGIATRIDEKRVHYIDTALREVLA